MRPGIIQRAWLRKLGLTISQLGTPGNGDRPRWAAGLEDIWELESSLDVEFGCGALVLMREDSNVVGSVEGTFVAVEAEGMPDSLPGFPAPARNREELERRCEELGIRVIGWLVAALDAPPGALVPGEDNDDVVARIALRSLSSLTIHYAFGTFEQNIVVDALCGADVRERLDRLALRLVDLPGLGWWSEEFAAKNFRFHTPGFTDSPVVVQAGEPLPIEALRRAGIGRTSRRGRRIGAHFKALDRGFRDLPRLFGSSWYPSSTASKQMPQSFRSTDPSWLVATREELRSSAGSFVVEGSEDPVEAMFVDELARNWTALCTEQFLGDDAGDRPLRALAHQELTPRKRRLWTIHSSRDWTELVLRFPMVLVPAGGEDSPATWGGNAQGVWLTVDWEKAGREYDGVYLSVLGSLDAAYVPLRVAIAGPRGERECWTMMTGWVPGSVMWLGDPLDSWPEIPDWSFDDVERDYEKTLARFKRGEWNELAGANE